ncbi:MAG: hypothetical protein PHQ00_03395 [Phycisphaerae bacterium]|nr:hypothetical protein [Phycisphaerae bacterium]
MNKIVWILAVLIIPMAAGCNEDSTADISRKDRLLANENLNLKNEIKQYLKEIEKQKALLQQCQQENERIQTEAGETTSFLMEQLPKDLMEQTERLTRENEQLRTRIDELEKTTGR